MLCIGAQKSGTSWLFQYFRARKDVYIPPIKELHFFDALFLPEICGYFDEKFERQRDQYLNQHIDSARQFLPANSSDYWKCLRDRVNMNGSPDNYFQFYAKRISTEQVFGEITPSYSMLSADHFSQIRSLYENSRFIFIVRNPIDRFWSAVRYTRGDRPDVDLITYFHECFEDIGVILRSNYKRTILELEKAIPTDQILYIFFEDLFSQNSIQRICDFLDIEFQSAPYDQVVNATEPSELNDHLRMVAFGRFLESYEFLYRRFEGQLPDSWLEDISRYADVKYASS